MSCLVLAVASQAGQGGEDRATAAARQQLTLELRQSGLIRSEAVLKVIHDTLRHRFVPHAQQKRAYLDMALPIGFQQTISSPLIVGQMTQELDPQPTDKVLEIGTGSGYQAAILSPLVAEVYSIEIVEPLGQRAARTLKSLDYRNVTVKVGDGFQGWPEHAPFDKIIVTCSPHEVPQPLVDQLREGGSMVIPVGERYQQVLYRMVKKQGKLERKALVPTLFVPMTGTAEAARPRAASDLASGVTLVNGNFELSALETDANAPAALPAPSALPSPSALPLPLPSGDGVPEGVAEDASESSGQSVIPGWYYERQVKRLVRATSPPSHFVRFTNQDMGRAAHLMQGLAIDGQQISHLRLSAQVRTTDVVPGPTPDMHPSLVITFYDPDRREIGQQWLGPWRGSFDWKDEQTTISVPRGSREAIVRLGLFGATGQLDIDNIQIAAGTE